MTDPHAAPAPLPTSPELEEEKVVTRRWGGAIEQDITELCRAQHAATLAHLAALAPEGIRELLDAFRGEVLATFSGHVWKGSTPPAESALLAAFTALRGERDELRAANAELRQLASHAVELEGARHRLTEERQQIFHALHPECPAYPGQPNTCDESACDCFGWDELAAQVTALTQRAEAAEGVAAKWEAEVKDRQWVRRVTNCGLCGASYCGDAAGELHGLGKCDAALAPRGASDGEGT